MEFLPKWARDYMEWNPMVVIFELARYGQFRNASDKYFYYGFLFATCAFFTYWGLLALRRVRARIHV